MPHLFRRYRLVLILTLAVVLIAAVVGLGFRKAAPLAVGDRVRLVNKAAPWLKPSPGTIVATQPDGGFDVQWDSLEAPVHYGAQLASDMQRVNTPSTK